MTFLKQITLNFLVISAFFFSVHTVWGQELNIYYSNDMHGAVEPCG